MCNKATKMVAKWSPKAQNTPRHRPTSGLCTSRRMLQSREKWKGWCCVDAVLMSRAMARYDQPYRHGTTHHTAMTKWPERQISINPSGIQSKINSAFRCIAQETFAMRFVQILHLLCIHLNCVVNSCSGGLGNLAWAQKGAFEVLESCSRYLRVAVTY